jgi:hypothetical protein
MKCYPSCIFANKESLESFTCRGCSGIMRRPVINSKGEGFGHACFSDNNEGPGKTLASIEAFINKLEVVCSYTDQCKWSGKLEKLDEHISNDCIGNEKSKKSINLNNSKPLHFENRHQLDSDQTVICQTCHSNVTKENIEAHYAYCTNEMIDCPIGCQMRILMAKIEDHIMVMCPNMQVNCPMRKYGCEFTDKRIEVMNHCSSLEVNIIHAQMISIGKKESQTLSFERNDVPDDKILVFSSNQADPGSQAEYFGKLEKEFRKINTNLEDIKSQIRSFDNRIGLVESKFEDIDIHGLKTELRALNLNLGAKFTEIQRPLANGISSVPQIKASIEFDFEARTKNIKLISPTEIISKGSGTIALLSTKVLPNVLFTFSIIKMSDENMGFGICSKKSVSQNNFDLYENDSNHGCFIIISDGSYKVDGSSEWITVNPEKFSFKEGDHITLEFSQTSHSLRIIDNNGESIVKLIIPQDLDLDGYYPFVRLFHTGDEVQIGQENLGCHLRFSEQNKGASLSLLSETRIKSLGHGSLAFLNNKLIPDFCYKFKITGDQSVNLALGVGFKDKLKSRGYQISEENDHGCFMFLSDGHVIKHSIPGHFTPEGSRINFGKGEILGLKYNSSNRRLTLINFETEIQSEILIDNGIKLDELYPCFQLGFLNDSVKIL